MLLPYRIKYDKSRFKGSTVTKHFEIQDGDSLWFGTSLTCHIWLYGWIMRIETHFALKSRENQFNISNVLVIRLYMLKEAVTALLNFVKNSHWSEQNCLDQCKSVTFALLMSNGNCCLSPVKHGENQFNISKVTANWRWLPLAAILNSPYRKLGVLN